MISLFKVQLFSISVCQNDLIMVGRWGWWYLCTENKRTLLRKDLRSFQKLVICTSHIHSMLSRINFRDGIRRTSSSNDVIKVNFCLKVSWCFSKPEDVPHPELKLIELKESVSCCHCQTENEITQTLRHSFLHWFKQSNVISC